MPDTKLPTAPVTPTHPVRSLGLKDKAPPKPARGLSSIPPALAVSGMASRIPPAPRPPRPPTRAQQHSDSLPKSVRPKSARAPNSRPHGSRPHSARPPSSRPKSSRPESLRSESLRRLVATTPAPAADESRDERQTARPVAATLRPAAQRNLGALLVGVAGAGLLLGSVWFLRESSRPVQSPAPAAAAATHAGVRTAGSPQVTRAPETASAVRSVDRETAVSSAKAPMAESEHVASSAHPAKQPSTANTTEAQPVSGAPAATNVAAAETEGSRAATGASPAADTATETPAPPPAALPAFDAGAAKRALGASAIAASSCRKGDDPRGTAEVIVTFAPSGRVTSANVNGAPYGGTATGGCIAATLRGATVPPFSGNHVTARKLVTVR